MAAGRAESDFGQQDWIDTLGLKQIFSIFSVNMDYKLGKKKLLKTSIDRTLLRQEVYQYARYFHWPAFSI